MEFKVQRQLTAALENVPGRFDEICQTIANHGITIEAISVVDNVDQGVTRLVTSDPPEVKRLLMEQQIYVVEADVLTVEMTDQRKSLPRISAAFAAEAINIDYMYGCFLGVENRTRITFRVSDLKKALAILADLEQG